MRIPAGLEVKIDVFRFEKPIEPAFGTGRAPRSPARKKSWLPHISSRVYHTKFEKRKIINDYRDRVAAHVDLKNPAYQPEWKDVKLYIDFLEEVISNLYFLSTYRSYGHPLGGAGIKSKETIEWFCKGISL